MNNLSMRKMNELTKKKKKGFTLVELIIVIAIIAVLAAIAIPKFGQVTRNSNRTADVATAKNISGVAAQLLAEGTSIDDIDEEHVALKLDGSPTEFPDTKLQLESGDKFEVGYDEDKGDITVSSSVSKKVIYPVTAGDYK